MTAAMSRRIEAADPRQAWSRRVLRIGGMIQCAFAAFWLVRGSLAVGDAAGISLAISLGTVALTAMAYGVRATAGLAPRPTGHGSRSIERDVTAATIIQIAASFALPAAALGAGRPDWVLPSVAITVGPLLLWLDHRLGMPLYRAAGWSLTAGPVLLAVALKGDALAGATGFAGGAILLIVAVAGFRDLAHL